LGTTILDTVTKRLCKEKRKEAFPRFWFQVLMTAKLDGLMDPKDLYEHLTRSIERVNSPTFTSYL